MTGSRLVRGTRSRLFLYVGVVVVVGLAVYVFHGAQLQLDDARKVADKCQQQQESLSAQLQVIFEYKLRLEKSLQQEKAEHRQTREELEGHANEERQLHDKETLESNNKYSALQQQYKLLQNQHEDLSEDCNKVRLTQLQGLEERSKLVSQVQALQAELGRQQSGHTKVLNALKSDYMKLEVENERLQKQVEELQKGSSHTSEKIGHLEKQNIQLERELLRTKKELETYRRNPPPVKEEKPSDVKNDADETLKSPVGDPDKAIASPSPSSPSSPAAAAPGGGLNADNQVNVLQQPSLNQENSDNKAAAQRSTTPQINPDAVLSQDRGQQQSNNVAPVPPPRQEKLDDVKEQMQHEVPNLPRPALEDPVNNWHHGNNVPAGVVPAPEGYGYHANPQNGIANNNNNNANGAGQWGWPKFRHLPQPIDPAHVQRDNNPLDDNGPEEEEEEDDPAHPHRSAQGEQQQEIPRQLHNQYHYNGADYDKEGPRGDLQLEEGEEEEDDDVDQIDYGNDAGGDAARRNKVANKQPAVVVNNQKKQHDGVMVNPK